MAQLVATFSGGVMRMLEGLRVFFSSPCFCFVLSVANILVVSLCMYHS